MSNTGTLFVVATPIGNFADFSPRAIETLRRASCICCEDTRVFGKLAQHFAIEAKKFSYYEHNEREKVLEAVEMLRAGENLALVSDAGTPGISDPGYRLVRACREAGIHVVPVPGPSAAIAALSVSGLPTDRFYFEGFLPVKKGKKSKQLAALLTYPSSVICYESPHRILHTINVLAELAPEREIFLARELTKTHEEHFFGKAKDVFELLKTSKSRTDARDIRGELVLVISPDKSKDREEELTNGLKEDEEDENM